MAEEREVLLGQGEYMVELKNLHKTYNSGLPALSNVTFGIKQNQVIGLLGPNGAGKSTTFNVLTLDTQRSFG